jgi:hypothetical protein
MGAFGPLAFLALAESALRILQALTGQAAGSAPVVALLGAWRELRARRPSGPPRLPLGTFDGVRDAVRPLPPTREEGAGHEVVSRLPKPHWTLNVTPIRYGGELWAAVERDERPVEGETRHRFVLRPYTEDTLRAAPVDYSTDEVERLHRESVRADRQMWVGLGGSLWGLLDAGRQERLAAAFDFDPQRQTRLSTTLGLAFGALAAVMALAYLVTGTSKAVDWLMLLGGIGLAAESLVRRRRLDREGRIQGSVLGVALRPFAARLARGLTT